MAGDGLRLLRWFRKRQRDFPWRTALPRDPYRVLVAEVMAQQTQIERVVPTYRRFVARFPTLASLAWATEDEAVREFSGLGYYRRARLLHRTARAIHTRGSWPTSRDELRQLPGFGPYTAAAVSAFCFSGEEPPVDSNIARVAARLGALALPLGSSKLLQAGHDLAKGLFADAGTAEVWEALMELGATVCAPTAPDCPACPLVASCAAAAAGRPLAYPLPKPRRAAEAQRWVAIWAQRPGRRVLLRQVEEGRLLRGMWLPPFQRLEPADDPATCARKLAAEAQCVGSLRAAQDVKHNITHRKITVHPFVISLRRATVAEPRPGWSWQDWRSPSVPTPSLLAKLADACTEVCRGEPGPSQWAGNED
ncbi:MAG: A/G-specific adenine glycosylase [Thermoanaerobaculales bacterium]